MLDEKDKEIERLKQETVGLQVKMSKVANGMIKLSTDLLVKMFSESRVREERGEMKYFYLKTEDGIVTGYETDIARSNNRNNATIHFNQ